MFDEVTRRGSGKGAVRRASFVLGSTVLQVLLLGGALAATAALRDRPAPERLVPVTFVPPAPPAPSSAPAAPPGNPMPAARPARAKPPAADAEPVPPAPRLVQPRPEPEAVPPEPPGPEPEAAPSPGPAGEGVVGGAPGGGGGAPIPGGAGALGPPGVVEDAPEDAAPRNLRPKLADPGCMRRSQDRERELKEHPELTGRVIRVEFQVSPTGALSGFRALDAGVDEPLARAMWSAVRRCRWNPGTDAEGRPATRTVSLGFRFVPE